MVRVRGGWIHLCTQRQKYQSNAAVGLCWYFFNQTKLSSMQHLFVEENATNGLDHVPSIINSHAGSDDLSYESFMSHPNGRKPKQCNLHCHLKCCHSVIHSHGICLEAGTKMKATPTLRGQKCVALW